MNGKRKYGFSGIFLVVLMLLLLYYLFAGMRSSGDISYAQLRQLFQQEQVQSFVIRDTRITADLKDGTTATCDLYSFDLFYDDLVSLQTFYGSISTGQIKDNGDGTYELLTPKDNTLDTSAWWHSPRDFGPKYMRKEFEEKVTLPTDQGDGLKLAEDALNAQYADNPNLLHAWPGTIKFTDDEINERTALNVDINSYVEAQWAHWITEGGVEEEWDDYLQQLDAMGLQRLIEIDQGAYDAYVEMMG